jgi:hypothetical protein
MWLAARHERQLLEIPGGFEIEWRECGAKSAFKLTNRGLERRDARGWPLLRARQ